MSTGQIEQFYGRVSNDQALFNQLTAGTETPDEFIDKAVALGAETGFSFSRDEADSWIKGQIDTRANGELSDLQLEAVAGGKNIGTTVTGYAASAARGAQTIHGWLTSW